MQTIIDGFLKALQLLFSGDPDVLQIALFSLEISGLATLTSLLVGLPLGTLLALGKFPGRRFWISLVNTGMALPPVVTGLTLAALQQLNPRLRLQLLGLGASRWQMIVMLWKEARLPLLAALMAGFGSIISEVGASMMVGGNLLGQTRVLTTAIVLETSKGEFSVAIALSVLLLLLAYMVNLGLTWIQQRNPGRAS